MIQITRRKTVFSGSEEDLERLRSKFDRQHYLRFHRFLEPRLMRVIQEEVVTHGKFYKKRHHGLAFELCMRANKTDRLLHFILNDEKLFQLIQKITGCGPIGCFNGRVYRMVPGLGHYHEWHSDLAHHRILGVSINLSPKVFQGGAFKLRNSKTRKSILEVVNTGFGDLLLFRLASDLEHRVSDIEGKAAKIAFAGWFSTRPKYLSSLKQYLRRPKK